MSGSGGGETGGGFERAGVACADLIINTQIGSPRADVLPSLKVGTILGVQVQQQNNVSVVVLLSNDKVAGGVASPDVQRLRECILGGTAYEARVTSVSGAQVGIRIAVAQSP